MIQSALTQIEGDTRYYRGHALADLLNHHSAESIATLLWLNDSDSAITYFDYNRVESARRYEMMLLHITIDGSDLSPIQSLQSLLPIMESDDPSPAPHSASHLARQGARLLRVMGSILAGDVMENLSLAAMLQQGWSPQDATHQRQYERGLICCADVGIDTATYGVRLAIAQGASLYQALTVGMALLSGDRRDLAFYGVDETLRTILNTHGKALDLLVLGRCIGWIGHSIEQHHHHTPLPPLR